MKLNYKRTILVGLAFLSICAFWQMYDSVVPLILANNFHLHETWTGVIMAADNVLALFLLPLFGSLSDRANTPIGRRMPFILFGTAASAILLLVLCLVLVLAVMGRTGHPGLSKLRGWSYAHRGLHGEGIPENSMAAFRAALEAGYGIELDVHLLKDGSLAIMHDSNLSRTTGCEGCIEDLTAEELPRFRLQGTEETIPLFRDVLALYDGKAPIIVELKSFGSNYAALTEAACAMLDTYPGAYCIESFDPRCVYWLRKHRPDIIRGQLSENFLASGIRQPWLLKFAVTFHLFNFLTMPDFIAYRYSDRRTLTNAITRKLWRVQGVSWTLRSKEEYDTAVREGWLPIFENFRP